jgi:hypothetical protein
MLDCDAFEAILTSGLFPKTFDIVRKASTKMLFKMYFLEVRCRRLSRVRSCDGVE